MATVGLRELRQDASELVRRVERGEQIEITVSGRAAARLVPSAPRQWLTWAEVGSAFDAPADPDWERDRQRLDDRVQDPWSRQ